MALVITQEQKAQIIEALTEHKGSLLVVGQKLGYAKNTIYNLVHRYPDIRRHWKAMKQAGDLAPKDAILVPESTLAQEVTMRVDEENSRFRADLNAIGMVHDASEMAVALAKFQRNHGMGMADMVQTGVGKLFFETQALLDKAKKDLFELDTKTPEGQSLAMGLRTHIENLINLCLKTNDSLSAGMVARARSKTIMEAGSKTRGQPPKGMLAIQAQAGSTVNVGLEGDKQEGEVIDAQTA